MQVFSGCAYLSTFIRRFLLLCALPCVVIPEAFAADPQSLVATTTSGLGPITPIVSCVSPNKDATCTAYFGYSNSSTQGVQIETDSGGFTGTQNSLFPGQSDRGQPKYFEPGEHHGVFSTDFSCDASVTWSIKPFYTGGRTATAKLYASKTCGSITPVAVCRESLPGGISRATFGYTNPNSFPLQLERGLANFLSTGISTEGVQPTRFQSGSVLNAFSVEYSVSSISWTLQGITAVADVSIPLCKENKRPICNAGNSPYSASCQGTQTTIALSSLGSLDPEGGPVALQWSTTCKDAALNNSTASNPSLTIKNPTDGGTTNCLVNLSVDDGVSVTSCSQEVQVTGCSTSCTTSSGEPGKIDICGVCGGDGTSCVDCAGVVQGTSVWDHCGMCGGTNTCVDCAGVPNGNAKLDRCGICNGDGKSCLKCTTSDISQLLSQMNMQSQSFRAAVEQYIDKVLVVEPTQANINWITEAKRDIERHSLQIERIAKEIPSQVTSCKDKINCTTSDRAAILQEYRDGLNGLRLIFNRSLRTIKRAKRTVLSKSERAQLQKVELLYSSAIKLPRGIPRFSSTCR